MKLKTRIIVDSTADLVPEVKARVYTVPLTVHFGQEEYIDGVTIDNKAFYEKLIESDVLPTTSQATPDAFMKEFEKARQAEEAAVVITLASKFSGTYQSAMIAASDYENVYVVDGTSAAMGTGILVELAFRLLDAGMSAKEIADALEEEKKKIVVVALVDTLEYLKRGGRISKTAALAGNLLGGHLFAVEEIFDVYLYGQFLIALAAVIEVGGVHMPGDSAVFADGLYIALDIGYILQRACVADLDLTLVGVEPIGDGYILDLSAVVHVDIDGLALFDGAGGVGIVYGRRLLVAGCRSGVAVIARFVDGKSPSVYFNCIRARRAVASRQNGMP